MPRTTLVALACLFLVPTAWAAEKGGDSFAVNGPDSVITYSDGYSLRGDDASALWASVDKEGNGDGVASNIEADAYGARRSGVEVLEQRCLADFKFVLANGRPPTAVRATLDISGGQVVDDRAALHVGYALAFGVSADEGFDVSVDFRRKQDLRDAFGCSGAKLEGPFSAILGHGIALFPGGMYFDPDSIRPAEARYAFYLDYSFPSPVEFFGGHEWNSDDPKLPLPSPRSNRVPSCSMSRRRLPAERGRISSNGNLPPF